MTDTNAATQNATATNQKDNDKRHIRQKNKNKPKRQNHRNKLAQSNTSTNRTNHRNLNHNLGIHKMKQKNKLLLKRITFILCLILAREAGYFIHFLLFYTIYITVYHRKTIWNTINQYSDTLTKKL